MAAINETAKKVNDLLKTRAGQRGKPQPTPQPILGPGTGKERSEAEIGIVWYKWCQDIIQDALTMQMETRPEQIAKVADPNAKGMDKEAAA